MHPRTSGGLTRSGFDTILLVVIAASIALGLPKMWARRTAAEANSGSAGKLGAAVIGTL